MVLLRLRHLPGSLVEGRKLGSHPFPKSGQADSAADSEMVLRPVALYPDPLRGDPHLLALCDIYVYNIVGALKPHISNRRAGCAAALERAFREQAWFGLEQEYALLELDWRPLGWPRNGFPAPMGPFYCGVGAGKAIGRDLVEAHMRAMMFAGLAVHGTNAEAMPSQWEWQLRPLGGLEAADQLWVGRFLLCRIAEDYNVLPSFDPKPVPGPNWSGSGVHVNFSTKPMREEGGLAHIEEAISKLSLCHKEHIAVYDPKGGLDNARRLTGANETAHIDAFSSGIGDRTVSIRIPREVASAKKGYLEDRRPSSNCDPYEVIAALTNTICLK